MLNNLICIDTSVALVFFLHIYMVRLPVVLCSCRRKVLVFTETFPGFDFNLYKMLVPQEMRYRTTGGSSFEFL